MKSSLIFRVGVRWMAPFLILLSFVIFWRGHQAPGGGFIGGLVASCGILLYALCHGTLETKKWLKVPPTSLAFAGLAFALLAAWWGPLVGQGFFRGIWGEAPVIGKIGTPMLFDFGVYLVVIGVVVSLLFALMEQEHRLIQREKSK